jgi:hypothetical protein
MRARADWRLPLIIAAPVLLWAALIWAVLQPLPTTASPKGATDTITFISTPLPTFVPAPYPSVAPPTPGPTLQPLCPPGTHPSNGVRYKTENGVIVHAYVGTFCDP